MLDATDLSTESKLWIGGDWVPPTGDNYFDDLNFENDSACGLSSTIFTETLNKALHYAHNVSAGLCHVNGSPIHKQPHVPFGGSGESGIGREGTGADIDAMTKWKCNLNKFYRGENYVSIRR